MENRDFKGIWIPKEVWLNKELKITEKVFLVEIDSLDNEKGCWASNKYFADFFGITKGRCSQIISSLKSKGLITITLKREGKEVKSRIIKVVNKLNRVVNKLNGVVRKSREGYLENDKDNNTTNNNTLNNITTKGLFKKPTVIEIKEYCIQRGNSLDAETFFDFYESKDWLVGNNKMKNWKASVRTWEKREQKKPQTMSKIQQHLQKNINVKEKLLKQLKN